MYRVKNEERWIEKSLKSAAEICDEIVIIDGFSTDNTVKICENFSKVVEIRQQRDSTFDEARDRNDLLKMALNLNPDFILGLDGDEIIQLDSKKILFEELNIIYPEYSVFLFQMLPMYSKPNQYLDMGPSYSWRPRLFRTENQPNNLHLKNTIHAGNLHCGMIPRDLIGFDKQIKSRVKLFHFSYYDEFLYQKKYDFYTKFDHQNRNYYKKKDSKENINFGYLPKGIFFEDIK